MAKLSVGLDIGVASVGWSVYDIENNELIDHGVRLFDQAEKAKDRRLARSLRRRYKRKNHRIERFNMLLDENKISKDVISYNNLVDIRIKALTEIVTEQELVAILGFYLRQRGYRPFDEDTRENKYKDIYKDKYACEIQKIILEEVGSYRGIDFPFLVEDFEKELRQILKTQKNDKITDEFIESYLKIYNSKREFYEGPGGARADQLTPFGRYTNKEDLEKYQIDHNYNKFLYEKLISDCAVYVGEKAAPKMSYTAQRFNFLNDFINITFVNIDKPLNDEYFYPINKQKTEYKFTLAGINKLEDIFLTCTSINLKNILKKEFSIESFDNVIGYRIDKSKKPEFTKYVDFKKIAKKLVNRNFLEDKSSFDDLAYILTVIPKNELTNKLKEVGYTDEEITQIKDVSLTDKKYHNYSLKALNTYIPLMEDSLLNSSSVERKFSEEIKSDVKNNKVENYFDYEDSKRMSTKYIDDLIANPQVKKGLKKTIKVFNLILDEYVFNKENELVYVVVESNKEALSDESKKKLEYFQADNEKKRQKALEKNGGNVNKIEDQLLLDEVDGHCIYCDEVININNMEKEHILPLSKSADNSFDNKTASCGKCNDAKGNRTPYEYLITTGGFEKFKNKVEKNKSFSETKIKNLLFTGNIDKYSKRFINRNLRDTAYTTSEFVKQLNYFNDANKLKERDLYFNTISMPPKITGLIRNKMPKDRNQQYHHAFDATIAAMFPTHNIGQFSNRMQNDSTSFWINKLDNTVNFGVLNNFHYEEKLMQQLSTIDYSNTRFYFDIKKGTNKKLSDEKISKIISTETKKGKQHYTIEYFSNIYELDTKDTKYKDLKKMLTDEVKKEDIGIKNDPKLYKLLQEIIITYHKVKYKNSENKLVELNPFLHYCCDLHDIQPDDFNLKVHGIRPEGKNGKLRPVVKRLSYKKKRSSPFFLNKKSINKKEDTQIALTGLDQSYTIVYRNLDNGKFAFMPIYSICTNLKTGEVNTNSELYKTLYEKFIGDSKVEELLRVYTNEYFRCYKNKDSKIFESRYRGFDVSTCRLEFKNGQNFTKSDIKIEKIPIYGLGIKNVNLEEKK